MGLKAPYLDALSSRSLLFCVYQVCPAVFPAIWSNLPPDGDQLTSPLPGGIAPDNTGVRITRMHESPKHIKVAMLSGDCASKQK